MLVLVKKARTATQGDTSMEWLKPFMTERKYRKGDILMKKGDAADEMLMTVTGKFLVKEISVELPPGRLMGELGFLTPDNRRTATIECIEDGHVLTITYEKLLEIYFCGASQDRSAGRRYGQHKLSIDVFLADARAIPPPSAIPPSRPAPRRT